MKLNENANHTTPSFYLTELLIISFISTEFSCYN